MFVEKTIFLTRNRWNDVAKKSCLGGFLNLIFDMEFSGERCLTPQPTTRGSMYFKFKQIGSLDLISAKSSSSTPQPKNTKKNRRKTRGKPPSFLGHKLVVFYLLLEGCCLYLKRSWVQFEIRNKFWAIPSAWPPERIRLALCFVPRLLSSMKKCQRCKWIQTSFIWMPYWMLMRHLGTLPTTCCVCLFSTVHYLGIFEGGRCVLFFFLLFK